MYVTTDAHNKTVSAFESMFLSYALGIFDS